MQVVSFSGEERMWELDNLKDQIRGVFFLAVISSVGVTLLNNNVIGYYGMSVLDALLDVQCHLLCSRDNFVALADVAFLLNNFALAVAILTGDLVLLEN
jgi:hypothetical protein